MASSNQSKRFTLELLDENVEEELKTYLADLEARLTIEGISLTLFNVIMELVSNAVKANLKRVYFRKHKFDITDPESYTRGLESFSRDYATTNTELYRDALRELDLIVVVNIDVDPDRLLIHVENNARLLEEEERRIRSKLSRAMDSQDIMEFYIHFGDETEGKGLGLAMVILLIKDIGFDPDNFRVYHEGDKTIARLEFPLKGNYIPLRDRFEEKSRERNPDA